MSKTAAFLHKANEHRMVMCFAAGMLLFVVNMTVYSQIEGRRPHEFETQPTCQAPEMVHHTVPRILHQIWIGDQKKAPNQLLERCREVHKNFKVMFWSNPEPWMENYELLKTKEVLIQTDTIRLEVLKRYGGLYLDADTECLRSMEPLLDQLEASGKDCIIARESDTYQPKLLANGAILCTNGTKTMETLVAGIPERVRKGGPPWMATGPKYMAEANADPSKATDFEICPSATFFPSHHADYKKFDPDTQLFLRDSYAYHHWGSTFRTYGQMKSMSDGAFLIHRRDCEANAGSLFWTHEFQAFSNDLGIEKSVRTHFHDIMEEISTLAETSETQIWISGVSALGFNSFGAPLPWHSYVEVAIPNDDFAALTEFLKSQGSSSSSGFVDGLAILPDTVLVAGHPDKAIESARSNGLLGGCVTLKKKDESYAIVFVPWRQTFDGQSVELSLHHNGEVGEVAMSDIFPLRQATFAGSAVFGPRRPWREASGRGVKIDESFASAPAGWSVTTPPDGLGTDLDFNAFFEESHKLFPGIHNSQGDCIHSWRKVAVYHCGLPTVEYLSVTAKVEYGECMFVLSKDLLDGRREVVVGHCLETN